uniref:Uncharacterized LOC100179242 n=1 Tax=Ciona intestinalis TaxID=7719 RepID=H2XVD9_CIOIN|nr:uncharacterized protein LOC100179242 [Ciona intestinalis]|eukprot:XP_009857747.1 uncharacterized protein LOC100179242 [Ciona intestinalis]
METSEALKTAHDDLSELKGKKVELSREKAKLDNHKQVFLAELKRIEAELSAVEGKLEDVNVRYRSVAWQITWLQLRRFWQLLCQAAICLYTIVVFIIINTLQVTYVALVVTANLLRNILDTQTSALGSYRSSKIEESSCWT